MEQHAVQDYLTLRHCPTLSQAHFSQQLQTLGSLQAFLATPENDRFNHYLQEPDADCRKLVDRELAWAENENHHLISFDSELYPQALKTIDRPPVLIAVKGRLDTVSSTQLAVVGSRRCSIYGEQTASWLARELAACGLTITSGLALGIDAAAHRGALDTGKTVAVVANGLDRIYPRRHQKLAEAIADTGAIISEHALGTDPLPAYFPQRNRLISGLALGVLVVEAKTKSGSLITARLAMEQNKDVFAVPGQIASAQASGCHHLLKTGAKLVEGPGDILDELPDAVLDELRRDKINNRAAPGVRHAGDPDPRTAKIMRLLAGGALPIESLLQHSDMTIDVLHGCLLQLEIQGAIESRAGRIHPRWQD